MVSIENQLAAELKVRPEQVKSAVALLDGGATVPFIARYRKEATGNLDLRPESHVTRIEHNDKGLVSGVVYFDKDGKEQRQKARVVCVAGNSIETPRLLLLSASNMFADGLANSSGQVGQYVRRFPSDELLPVPTRR
jgi:choline dehydrogenase-like flavoprotein